MNETADDELTTDFPVPLAVVISPLSIALYLAPWTVSLSMHHLLLNLRPQTTHRQNAERQHTH